MSAHLRSILFLAALAAASPALAAPAPVTPPAPPAAAAGADADQAKVDEFVQKFAAQHEGYAVARLELTGVPAGDDVVRGILDRVTLLIDPKSFVDAIRRPARPDAVTVVAAPVPNPKALADRLKFAAVAGVDLPTRTIRATVTAGADLKPLWTTYTSKDGNYAVDFPGEATKQPGSNSICFGVEVENTACLVSHSDIADAATPREILDRAESVYREGYNVWARRDAVTEGGHPARYIMAEDKEGDFYLVRLYLVNKRLYQTMVVTTSARRFTSAGEQFQQSFRLLTPATALGKVEFPNMPAAPKPGEKREPRSPTRRDPAKTPDAPPTTPAAPADPAPAKPDAPQAADPTPPDGADAVTTALYGLKSADQGKRRKAAQELRGMAVDPKRRDEVSKALVPLLSEAEQWGKMEGLKALAIWWTADVLPAMIKCTQDKEFAVRWAALDALGQVKDVRAAEAAADCLATDRGAAAKALKAIGSLAEPALIKRLRDTDRAVRVEACKILGEVGTRRSLPALTALKNDKELKGHVERAIEAISARK